MNSFLVFDPVFRALLAVDVDGKFQHSFFIFFSISPTLLTTSHKMMSSEQWNRILVYLSINNEDVYDKYISELRNGAVLNYATFENSKYVAKQTNLDIYTNILNFSAKY